MRRSLGSLGGIAVVVAAAFALALGRTAMLERRDGQGGKTLHVHSERGFAIAVRRLSRSGGTIVLHQSLYRRLVIPPRSWRPLRIVGSRGVRVQNVLFYYTQHVSLGKVRVGPIGGDALVEVRGSRHILLHDLVVSARRTRGSRRRCAFRTPAE